MSASTQSTSRASHSLSRRSAAKESSRRGNSTGGSRRSLSNLSAEVEALSAASSVSAATTRKSRLVNKISERDEAERKERDREQRKALLKEKRTTAANLVQARHAASEQASKIKRGLDEITKVNTEIDRLEKWRQGQLDRLQMLMRQLAEEQRQMEEEFEERHSEADDIKSTLELEQAHLESEAQTKDQEVSAVEGHMQSVEEELQRLDDGAGVTSSGCWKSLNLDDGSFMSRGSVDGGASISSYAANLLEDMSVQKSGESAKAVLRSEARPVPLPITPSRSVKSADTQAPPVQRLLEDQVPNKARGGEPNGVAEKQRQQTPRRQQSPQPATDAMSQQPQPSPITTTIASNVNQAGLMNNAAGARRPDISPLRTRSPGQQHPQAPQAVFRTPSAGPTAARMAPSGISGYPAVTRQMPQSDPRLQPQPYTQATMLDGLVAPVMSREGQMPMRSAPNSASAPVAQGGFFTWDM